MHSCLPKVGRRHEATPVFPLAHRAALAAVSAASPATAAAVGQYYPVRQHSPGLAAGVFSFLGVASIRTGRAGRLRFCIWLSLRKATNTPSRSAAQSAYLPLHQGQMLRSHIELMFKGKTGLASVQATDVNVVIQSRQSGDALTTFQSMDRDRHLLLCARLGYKIHTFRNEMDCRLDHGCSLTEACPLQGQFELDDDNNIVR